MLDMACLNHLVVSVFSKAGRCAIIVEFSSSLEYLSV